jgi:predicted metalloenzyme YecM
MLERKSLKEYWDERGKLPYVLDLFYDVKVWEDVEAVMAGEPTRCDCTAEELVQLVEEAGYYL